MLKIIFSSLTAFLFFLCPSQVQHNPKTIGYELYSWQDKQCNWMFSLLPNTSSEKTVEMVFNEKKSLRGVEQLRHELGKLPEGERIYWFDRVPSGAGPKAKGSEGLTYPPLVLIDEIKSYSKGKGITLEVLPSGSREDRACVPQK